MSSASTIDGGGISGEKAGPPLTACYVLATDGASIYADLTTHSMRVLRRTCATARIVLLTDRLTHRRAESAIHPCVELADAMVIAECPYDDVTARSRFVKTSMRSLLSGPFMFLDADAFALERLDEGFQTAACLAAVPDRNRVNPNPHFPEFARRIYEAEGWRWPVERYFNSGVMFWQDNDEARLLGDAWHRCWQDLYERTGQHTDQPSLNRVIEERCFSVSVLPPTYNAMVAASPWFGLRAKVLHVFAGKLAEQSGAILGVLKRYASRLGPWRPGERPAFRLAMMRAAGLQSPQIALEALQQRAFASARAHASWYALMRPWELRAWNYLARGVLKRGWK